MVPSDVRNPRPYAGAWRRILVDDAGGEDINRFLGRHQGTCVAAALMLVIAGCGGDAPNGQRGRAGAPGDSGHDELPTDPPPGTPRKVRDALAYRVTTPAAALATLHRIAEQWRRYHYEGAIISIRAATANFWTDRGMQALPAWAVKYGPRGTSRTSGTAYVMGVAPPDRYGPDPRVLEDFTAYDNTALGLSDDGMTLLVHRPDDGGTPTGPCRTIYTTSVVETRTAIAFKVDSVRQSDPTADCSEVEHNYWARAEVKLSRPLGNRVVIATDGSLSPYPVLPCGSIPTRPLYVPSCKPSAPSDGPSVVTGGPIYGREYGPE